MCCVLNVLQIQCVGGMRRKDIVFLGQLRGLVGVRIILPLLSGTLMVFASEKENK